MKGFNFPSASAKKERKLIDGGVHSARCISIVDMGTQKGIFPNDKGEILDKRQVNITWELPDIMEVFSEEKGAQPQIISKIYPASFFIDKNNVPKSNLAKDLLSWFSDKQPDGDLSHWLDELCIGRTALLTISQSPNKKGVMKNKIDGVSPLPKKMTCEPQINPSIKFDMTGTTFDDITYNKLNKWLQEQIALSPEYAKLKGIKSPGKQEGFDDLPF